MQLIDVDGFNRRWPSWECMKISRRKTGKGIALQTEIDLYVFSAGVSKRDLSANCQQNWSMKNDQEHRTNGQAGDHTTPKLPVTPLLRLVVFGHRAILLPLYLRAKGKCRSPTRLPT
jgi:hypothetical protein